MYVKYNVNIAREAESVYGTAAREHDIRRTVAQETCGQKSPARARRDIYKHIDVPTAGRNCSFTLANACVYNIINNALWGGA